MFVPHQLRKLAIGIGRNCWLIFRRRVLQRPRQRCGYFLQRVVPEITFRDATRQVICQPKLVLARRQSANLQRNVLGGARPDVVGQAAQSFNLIVDWLLLRTPDDLLLLRPNKNRTHDKHLDHHNTQRSPKQGPSDNAHAATPKNSTHRLTTSAVILPLCRHWSDEGARRKRTALFTPSFASAADFEAKR